MADGMSFRGCLSGGGDIFSKSVEKQGGANRTFATGGRAMDGNWSRARAV